MTPGSSLTLAQAILSLSNLQGLQSTTLLKLAEELLKQQVHNYMRIDIYIFINNVDTGTSQHRKIKYSLK